MARGKNERPTENDWNSFKSISAEKKIEAMCEYLLVKDATMPNIERKLFRKNGGYTVSMIHRCYNFSGRNDGKYAPSSEFCHTYGEVYQEDIEAFVKKYPNGITYTNQIGTGIELENFLKERIAQRQLYVQEYGDDYEDYDNEYDSDYEESSFHNDMNYQNSRNNRKKSNNNLSISQYNSRQNDNSYNTGNSYTPRNFDDTDAEIIGVGILGLAVIFVVLALIFNWFHWRSKLLVFISDWIQVVWLFGMLIFLLRIIMGKVDFMYGKKFISKVVSFLIIGAITYFIVSLFGYLCYYFSMK